MKMASCKKNTVELTRIAVFAFNVLFLLLGLTIFGIGMWVNLNVKSMDALMNSRVINIAAVIMIAAGAIVVLISLIGFYVIKKKLRKWLNVFAICVLIIFVLEFAGGLYAFTNRKKARKLLNQGIDHTVVHRYSSRIHGCKIPSTALDLIKQRVGGKPSAPRDWKASSSAAMDWIQKHVGCCGSNGPHDWKASSWYLDMAKKGGILVPTSCCIHEAPGCNVANDLRMLVSNGRVYPKGCKEKADVYLKRYFTAVGQIGIAIAFVQLIGIALLFSLSCALKKKEKKTNTKSNSRDATEAVTHARSGAKETLLVHTPIPSVVYYPHVNQPILVTQQGTY